MNRRITLLLVVCFAVVSCASEARRPISSSTASPLPSPVTLHLPARGLAVEVASHRVRLFSLSGRPLARVRAEVANDTVSLHPWLVDRFGRKLALKGGAVTFGDVRGKAPGPGAYRMHAGVPPGGMKGVGHWEMGALSPNGQWVLGQWSGECEVPTAYVIDARTDHINEIGDPVSGLPPESIALGWLSDKRALVHFPLGACGTSVPRPGVYVVDPSGAIVTRIVGTPRFTRAYMWGS